MEIQHPLNIASFLPHEIQAHYLHVIMLFVAMCIITLIGLYARKLRNEVPNKSQNFFEMLVEGLYGMGDNIMGKDGRPYMPLVFGIGAYVIVSNYMGLIPGFAAPTSNMNTTAAPALCVFLFYNYLGIKRHGFGYIKQFLGPIALLAPFMFIIEVIGHFARPLSLTMRLFGNVAGEDLVIAILFVLVPFMLPLPMFFLALFASSLQAFVFMILTMVYIAGALEEAH